MAIDDIGDAVEFRTPRFATDRQPTTVHHCRGRVADPSEYLHNLPLVVDTLSCCALRRRDCWRPATAAIAGSRSGLSNNRLSGSVDLEDQPQTVCRRRGKAGQASGKQPAQAPTRCVAGASGASIELAAVPR